MSFRLLPAVGATAILSGLALGGPASPPRAPGPAPAEQASRTRVPPETVDSDLEAIRDIFRFGDDVESRRPSVEATPDRPEVTASESTPAPPARLVGLVRGRDRLRVALALEGEVVLLGADDSALGYTVLDISEERVILRDPGGEEITLTVGPS